jgi:response regulator of citrate/malate metabolism
MTCNKSYVGQSGRTIAVRYKEHIRYIRTNTLTSAYAIHTLNQCHDYGLLDDTLYLLKPCAKENLMNCWESFYTQQLHHLNLLIDEKQPQEPNPLYALSWEAQQAEPRHSDTQAT